MSNNQSNKLHQAALDAIEATNLCMEHMEYHGQKFEDCTPQKRVLIEVKEDEVEQPIRKEDDE